MDILRHRPLFALCSACTLAVLMGFFLPVSVAVALGALVLAGCAVFALILFLCRRCIGKGIFLVALALVACLGLFRAQTYRYNGDARYTATLEGSTAHVEGVVLDREGEGGYTTSYTLEVHRINDRDVNATAYLSCHYVAGLSAGDTVTLDATVLPLSEVVGDAYNVTALMGDGYTLGLLSEEEESLSVTGKSRDLRVMAGNLRRSLAATLSLVTGEDADGLPSALLLGERSGLSDTARRDFARAGVSHMLAISGLHMTLLFGMLALILRLVGLSRRLQVILLGVAVTGYLILLGFPPSATRAAVMLGMTYLSTLLFCRADPLTSLGLAAALILLATPNAAADAGFWMSYLSTLGLVTLSPVVGRWLSDRVSSKHRVAGFLLRCGISLVATLAVGVIAMSMTLSVVSSVIGEMSLISPISTVILTPICGAILLGSLVTLPLSGIALGSLIGKLVGMLSALMADLAERLGDPSWTVISLRHPLVLPIAVVMLVALIVLLCVRLPRRARAVTLLPLLVGWIVIGGVLAVDGHLTRDTADASYIQPSSQSEFLVFTSEGRGLICDLSNGSVSSSTAALREAKLQGATEIAAYAVTHYHTRTLSGLAAALSQALVRELWLPTPTSEDEYDVFRSCLDVAARHGVPVCLYSDGEALTVLGDARLTVSRAELARSTQPILLVSLATEEENILAYVGASAFESSLSDTAAANASSADTVIFGSHGPIIKENFGEELLLSATSVILSAHGDVTAHVDPEALSSVPSLWLGQQRMTLPLS